MLNVERTGPPLEARLPGLTLMASAARVCRRSCSRCCRACQAAQALQGSDVLCQFHTVGHRGLCPVAAPAGP